MALILGSTKAQQVAAGELLLDLPFPDTYLKASTSASGGSSSSPLVLGHHSVNDLLFPSAQVFRTTCGGLRRMYVAYFCLLVYSLLTPGLFRSVVSELPLFCDADRTAMPVIQIRSSYVQ